MTVRIIYILLLSAALTSFSPAEGNSGQKGKLIVRFEGFRSSVGNIKIALCNSSDNYDDHHNPYIGKVLSVRDKYVLAEFEELPFGEYAIKAFHDADSDDDLTTNFLGIPVEDYGFSNNARGIFGPPSWDKAKFSFNKDTHALQIQIK